MGYFVTSNIPANMQAFWCEMDTLKWCPQFKWQDGDHVDVNKHEANRFSSHLKMVHHINDMPLLPKKIIQGQNNILFLLLTKTVVTFDNSFRDQLLIFQLSTNIHTNTNKTSYYYKLCLAMWAKHQLLSYLRLLIQYASLQLTLRASCLLMAHNGSVHSCKKLTMSPLTRNT